MRSLLAAKYNQNPVLAQTRGIKYDCKKINFKWPAISSK